MLCCGEITAHRCKLQAMSSSHTTTGLFRIDNHVNKVESLLNMKSLDVLIVGIWECVVSVRQQLLKLCASRFVLDLKKSFFLNLRQQSDLQRSLIHPQLLGQEILKMGSLSFQNLCCITSNLCCITSISYMLSFPVSFCFHASSVLYLYAWSSTECVVEWIEV
jgi:hypothetical protein